MMVPSGLKNLAPGSKLTSSDKNVYPDNLAKPADGDKSASDQSILFLRRARNGGKWIWAAPQELFALVIWHAHTWPSLSQRYRAGR